jgi:hypothetical protein
LQRDIADLARRSFQIGSEKRFQIKGLHGPAIVSRRSFEDVMVAIARNYRKLLHLILAILAGFLALTALKDKVSAQTTHTFVIPVDDGYGLNDCIGKDRSCAEVVAAAWCEAHGYAAPIVFGRAQDIVTGAISTTPQPAHIDPDSFIVTCKE